MVACNMMTPFEHRKTFEFATSTQLPEETDYWFPNWKELFPGLLVTKNQKTNLIHDIDGSNHRNGIVYSEPQKFAANAQSSSTQPLCLHPEHVNISILPACSIQQTQQVHAHTVQNIQASVPIPTPSQNGTPLWSHQDADNLKQTQETNEAPSLTQATGIIIYTIKSPQWLPQGWITEMHIRRPHAISSTSSKYFKHVASGRRFRSRKDVLHFINTGKVRAKKMSVRKKDQTYITANSLLDTPANRTLCIMESHESSTQNPPENKHLAYKTTLLTLELSELEPNTTMALPCKQRDSLHADGSIHTLEEKEPAIERAHDVSVTEYNVVSYSNDKQTSEFWQPPLTKSATLEDRPPLNSTTFTAVNVHQMDVEIPKGVTDRAATRKLLKKLPARRVIQLTKEIQTFENEATQMNAVSEVKATKNVEGFLTYNSPTADGATQLTKKIQTADMEGIQMNSLTEVADIRSVKNLKLHDPKADRATQLRNEIQAAHNEVVQISREMQAAAEKLSTEILVAKRNAELGYNMQASKLPTPICVEREDRSESSKSCKPNFDTLSKVITISSMEKPVCRPCEVTSTPPSPAPLPRCESCGTSCWQTGLNDMIDISTCRQPPIQHVASIPTTYTSSPSSEILLNVLSNINIHPVLQLAKTAHASIKPATQTGQSSHGEESDHGKQSGKTGPEGAFLMHAVPAAVGIAHQTERPSVTDFYATQPVSLRSEPILPIRQPSQQMISMSLPSITKTGDETDPSDHELAQPVNYFTEQVHGKINNDHIRTNNMKQTDRNDDDDNAQVSERQKQWKHHRSEIPCTRKEEATLSHGLRAHASDCGKEADAEEQKSIGSAMAVETEDSTNGRQSSKWQQMEAMKSKFSAVLNPKLDLSGLSPSLTARQRGKEVEKMKARHARQLLASLGKNVCRQALCTNALSQQPI